MPVDQDCAELRKNIGHGGALVLLLVRHMLCNSARSACDERTGIGDWSFTRESIPRPNQSSNHQRDAHTQQRAWQQAVPPKTTEGTTSDFSHFRTALECTLSRVLARCTSTHPQPAKQCNMRRMSTRGALQQPHCTSWHSVPPRSAINAWACAQSYLHVERKKKQK